MQECNCENCKCEHRYCGKEMEEWWGAPCYRDVCNCPYDGDITECPYWEDALDTSTCDGCIHNLDTGCDVLIKNEQKQVWVNEDCEKYEGEI